MDLEMWLKGLSPRQRGTQPTYCTSLYTINLSFREMQLSQPQPESTI